MSRPDVVKSLWKYIKKNDLQDPADKRYIKCDKNLRKIFEQDRIHSFTMNRDLSKHLTKKDDPKNGTFKSNVDDDSNKNNKKKKLLKKKKKKKKKKKDNKI